MMSRWLRAALVLWTLQLSACAVAPSPAAQPSVAAGGEGSWHVAHRESAGALASVWGSGPQDVWAAGGRRGHGLVLHNDGHGWRTVDVQPKGFVWWIYGRGPADVYTAGEGGLVYHFDGKVWHQVPSGTTATLYGLWTDPAGGVWAVGGDPWGQPGNAVVLRGDANGLQPVAIEKSLLPAVLYKIYGAPMGDIVAVGAGGTVLRGNIARWQRDSVPTAESIVSLWGGGGQRLYAVGGDAQGLLLDYDGKDWQPVGGLQPGLQLFGVFAASGQPVIAAGAGPRVVEVAAQGDPVDMELDGAEQGDVLHSVWGDGQGHAFAVGGELFGDPDQMRGVIFERR